MGTATYFWAGGTGSTEELLLRNKAACAMDPVMAPALKVAHPDPTTTAPAMMMVDEF